jgi:hypothetical protein
MRTIWGVEQVMRNPPPPPSAIADFIRTINAAAPVGILEAAAPPPSQQHHDYEMQSM